MKTTMIVVSLVICLLCSVSMTYQTPRQFEYKFEYAPSEKKANQLGAEGWELVAIQSPSGTGLGNNIPTFVFRRAK